jgi:hypothetical protein
VQHDSTGRFFDEQAFHHTEMGAVQSVGDT